MRKVTIIVTVVSSILSMPTYAQSRNAKDAMYELARIGKKEAISGADQKLIARTEELQTSLCNTGYNFCAPNVQSMTSKNILYMIAIKSKLGLQLNKSCKSNSGGLQCALNALALSDVIMGSYELCKRGEKVFCRYIR